MSLAGLAQQGTTRRASTARFRGGALPQSKESSTFLHAHCAHAPTRHTVATTKKEEAAGVKLVEGVWKSHKPFRRGTITAIHHTESAARLHPIW